MFFGAREPSYSKPRQPKVQALTLKLSVSLKDVYTGKTIKFPINVQRVCTDCDGKGSTRIVECPDCNGKGYQIKIMQSGPGMIVQTQKPCYKCNQKGKYFDEKDRCDGCKGKKIKFVQKSMEIPIEQGVLHEKMLSYPGEGNEMPGATVGDLNVKIAIKEHPTFKREGADLYMAKKVSLKEALTGLNFSIKHLDDSTVNIVSGPGEMINPSVLKVIKGKGMPFYKDIMEHGNLVIKFEIEWPAPNSISSENIEILRKALPGAPALPQKKDTEYHKLEDWSKTKKNTSHKGGRQSQFEYEDDESYDQSQNTGCRQM